MSGHILNDMLTAETKAAHRATWFVWVGDGSPEYPRGKIRHQATMRGFWGYDVRCSCGWKSRTGGATRNSVEDALWDHRYEAQCSKNREEEGI